MKLQNLYNFSERRPLSIGPKSYESGLSFNEKTIFLISFFQKNDENILRNEFLQVLSGCFHLVLYGFLKQEEQGGASPGLIMLVGGYRQGGCSRLKTYLSFVDAVFVTVASGVHELESHT